jgi:hypothetical protein
LRNDTAPTMPHIEVVLLKTNLNASVFLRN